MISGKIYCGHCGSRLTLTTNGRYRKKKDGSIDKTKRIRYVCYGKTRKQTECNGQTGYTLHILNDLIDEVIRDVFIKIKSISKSDIIKSKYTSELETRKKRLDVLRNDYAKGTENLNILKAEVVKSIKGESSFSTDILSDLITKAESECDDLLKLCKAAESDLQNSENLLKELSDSFDELISWAEIYDKASFEKKKMIANYMIKRVEVTKGYELKIDFNFNFKQFLTGIDKEDVAA